MRLQRFQGGRRIHVTTSNPKQHRGKAEQSQAERVDRRAAPFTVRFERAPCWRLHPQARPVVVHELGIALFCRLTATGRRDQPSADARVRYEPPAFYGFLQTPPLASAALAIRILFPTNRARSVTSTDGVCQLRWANKKGLTTDRRKSFDFSTQERT